MKKLIAFDDIIADIHNNEKLNKIVTELFIRVRKLNNSLVSITQSYFEIPKDFRPNTAHFVTMQIPNKKRISTNCI